MAPSLRKLIPLLLLAFVTALLAAACGSDTAAKSVPPGAIALVGDKAIPKAELDRLIAQAKKNYEAENQQFPETGTPEYENVKSLLVKNLVEQSQWEQAGAALGVTVSAKEVQTKLDADKQQYFKGDEEKYKAFLEKRRLSDQQVRERIRAKLLSDKIYEAVVKNVSVSDAEITAYYNQHKDQYAQPESRDVRHILLKTKALADRIYNELRGGADFAKLARKYSQDAGTKDNGGKYTAYRGRSVEPFDKFVFAAKTGELSQPVKTQFGWHVIEVLSDVKPASTKTLAEARDSISSTLLPQQQNQALRNWAREAQAKYKVTYAPGYAPPPSGTTTG